MTKRRTSTRLLAVALVYLLAACLGLYGLLLDPTRNVGATLPTDYYHFNWNYWWIRHALATGQNVYLTDYVLAPATTNLAYHTLTPFWYPAWALIEPALTRITGDPLRGTVAAMNALYVVATALTGGLCYAFLRRESAPRGWALAGGFAFMFTPALTVAAFIGDINYVSQFWYPALLLGWGWVSEAVTRQEVTSNEIQGGQRGQLAKYSATRFSGFSGVSLAACGQTEGLIPRREGVGTSQQRRSGTLLLKSVLFGGLLYGAAMTDYQHLLFAAFLLLPYGVWTIIRAKKNDARLRLMAAEAVSLVVFVGVLALAGTLGALLAFDRAGLSPQAMSSARGIPFPTGYFWQMDEYATRAITLGAFPLLAAAFALVTGIARRARDGRWLWLIIAIPPLLFSAGPTIMLGAMAVETPYVGLHQALGGLFRSPARFAPLLVLLAFAAGGVALRWLKARGLRLNMAGGAGTLLTAMLILGVLADARAFQPMPVRPAAPRYAAYEQIGRERGANYDNLIVLDVPVAGGSGEAWVGGGTAEFPPMETQLYAMVHQKRVLNGSIARAPLSNFWYWLVDDPMLAWLGQRRYLEAVAAQFAERMAAWPIGYVAVHQAIIGREHPANVETLGYLNAHPELVCPFAIEQAEGMDAPAVFYRTMAHPDVRLNGCPPAARTPPMVEGGYVIDIGANDDARFIGWGWHAPEVVGGGVTWRWIGAQHPTLGGVDERGEYRQDTSIVHRQDARLYLAVPPGMRELVLHVQAFGGTRRVRVMLDGEALGEAEIAPDALAAYRFSLPLRMIGGVNVAELVIAYDGAGEADGRRLAVAVDRVELRP